MRSFTDSEGREWQVSVTVGSIRRVRDLLGVNLSNYLEGEPPLIDRLQRDVVLLGDVLYCLVKPQADERGVSDEKFGSALSAEAFGIAVIVFWEEFSGFFRHLAGVLRPSTTASASTSATTDPGPESASTSIVGN